MSNLFRLTKINFLSLLNIKKSTKKHQKILSVLLVIFVVLLLSFYLYMGYDYIMKGLILLNIPYILLVLAFCVTSLTIFLTNTYRVNGIIFGSKDYDLLMSLPIKKKTILTSKIISLYLNNLVSLLFFILPALIVYLKYVPTESLFLFFFITTLFIIPLIPLIFSIIIGAIIMWISSQFTKKEFFNIILMIIFTILVLVLNYTLSSKSAIDVANISNSILDKFNAIYPLTNIYAKMISLNSFKYFSIFTLISVFTYFIFINLFMVFFNKINNKLIAKQNKVNHQIKTFKTDKPIKSLLKKEATRYFSSPIYVLNTSIGLILLLIIVIASFFLGASKIETLIGFPGLLDNIVKKGPFIISLFVAMSCTTYPSISLEGKNLWIIKSLPINAFRIFMSKIIFNLYITIPAIIISAILLAILLNYTFLNFILLLIIPILMTVFISIMGLLINLKFPRFDWKNEVAVIKQSVPSFLVIIGGMIINIILLTLKININYYLYYSLIVAILAILIINLIIYLQKNSNKILLKL